jgi:hypothetical protein
MRRNSPVPSHTLGADGGIRTHDLPLTRRLLCQLSYVGILRDK